MTKTHRQYEFGTFSERLEHLSTLFEVDLPEIVYTDGGPELTDSLMDWIKANEVNMDWLFAGSPSAMLRAWAKQEKTAREFSGALQELEPEVQNGVVALMRATIIHKIDMEAALRDFRIVVQEYRAGKLAS